HMNVFLLPPLFLLGIALGLLALRSGSLLPGIILLAGCYALLLAPIRSGDAGETDPAVVAMWHYAVAVAATLAAAGLLWWQNRRNGSGLWEALLAVPQPLIPHEPETSQFMPPSGATAK